MEDLYFGEIQPNISNYDKNPRIKKSVQAVDENEEILLKILDGKERKLFLDLVNAQSEVDGGSAVDKFIVGLTKMKLDKKDRSYEVHILLL